MGRHRPFFDLSTQNVILSPTLNIPFVITDKWLCRTSACLTNDTFRLPTHTMFTSASACTRLLRHDFIFGVSFPAFTRKINWVGPVHTYVTDMIVAAASPTIRFRQVDMCVDNIFSFTQANNNFVRQTYLSLSSHWCHCWCGMECNCCCCCHYYDAGTNKIIATACTSVTHQIRIVNECAGEREAEQEWKKWVHPEEASLI